MTSPCKNGRGWRRCRFWAFRYPWDAKSYQDYYTFVRTDFEPKPIYEEVQRYAAARLSAQAPPGTTATAA